MIFNQATLNDCHQADGLVVVIDVIRAFSTAAYAFNAGAAQITLVSTIEEALELRSCQPDWLVMGELQGLPIEGFDLWNSPSQISGLDLNGRYLVQRTSAGTQGVVRSQRAEVLLTASFCTAGATARYIRQLKPDKVTFVATGAGKDGFGDEDVALGDYLQALLEERQPDPLPYLDRVRFSKSGQIFSDPAKTEFPMADLACCLALDRFNFVMKVQRASQQLVMKPLNVL
jgi:2-phosphosulfolactate phosphatase